MKTTTRLLCTIIALTLAPGLATAGGDFVETTDGALLKGTIVGITETDIILETDYAGTLEIDRDQVRVFETEQSLYLRLQDGSTVLGRVAREGEDGIRVEGAEVALSTEPASVTAAWGTEDAAPEVRLMEEALAEKERRWKYELGVDLSGRSGNTDRFSSAVRGSATLESTVDILRFYAAYERGEVDGETTADEILGGVSYTSYFYEDLGWYARMEIERDEFEGIDLRTTVAGGLSYRILNEPHHSLESRLGLGYRYENYLDGTSDDQPTLDVGLLHSWQFSPWARVRNELTYQPDLQDFSDYLLNQDSGLEMPLGRADWWVLRVGVANAYNSKPHADRKKRDTTYYARLILTWE